MDNIVLFIIYSCTFLLFIILRFKLKRGQLKTLTLWLENIPLTKNSQVYIKNSNNKKNFLQYHTKQEVGKKHMCFEVLPECHP